MDKWETVFTQVLTAMVANSKDDLVTSAVKGNIDTDADLLAMTARKIANAAIREIRFNAVKP